jgi:hypothetical protein
MAMFWPAGGGNAPLGAANAVLPGAKAESGVYRAGVCDALWT